MTSRRAIIRLILHIPCRVNYVQTLPERLQVTRWEDEWATRYSLNPVLGATATSGRRTTSRADSKKKECQDYVERVFQWSIVRASVVREIELDVQMSNASSASESLCLFGLS